MEKIIQLKEYEYNKLIEASILNESEIKRLADRMYKKNRINEMQITVLVDSEDGTLVLKPKSNIYGNGKYSLTFTEKRQIIDFTEKWALKFMKYKFGESIDKVNFLRKDILKFKRMKRKWFTAAIIGWIIAVTSLIFTVLK